MPMLAIDRWATGPDQLDEHSYRHLKLALQLATLFLTEDSTLGWFCHYTFGHRKKDASGPYISPTKYSTSEEALRKVKRNIKELGKVITFMFNPNFSKRDNSYGVTYNNKRHLPFFHHFRKSEWPDTSKEHSRRHPVVVMHNEFSKYFSQEGLLDTSRDVWLRTQFLFAITLVHEIAHAYSMWLEKDYDEPRWSKDDRKAELGFSWEKETIGYLCNPLFHEIKGCEMLLSMKAVSYKHGCEQPEIVEELIGQHPLHFNAMNPAHFQDLFQLEDYRGGRFYAEQQPDSCRNWVIAIYALSLDWIAAWFDERHWEARHRTWRQTHEHIPPPLGMTFVLVYQKQSGGTIWVHYPLDPRIEEDMQHIPSAAEQERLRGGAKLPNFPASETVYWMPVYYIY